MMPTPTPAPPMPKQARPAPMYFAATGSITKAPCWVDWIGFGSMTRMNGVVEIDAGEDREHVGLQEGDQELQRAEHDDHRQGQHGAEPAGDAETCEQGDEAGEHLERD